VKVRCSNYEITMVWHVQNHFRYGQGFLHSIASAESVHVNE